MRRKNGFTLLELLGILVILAIIALISIPIITNLIKNSRIRTTENAVNGLYKAIDVYYGRQIVNNAGLWFDNNTVKIAFGSSYDSNDETMINGNETIEFSGTIPTSGILTVDRNGKILVEEQLVVNKYYCTSSNGDRQTIKCSESSFE